MSVKFCIKQKLSVFIVSNICEFSFGHKHDNSEYNRVKTFNLKVDAYIDTLDKYIQYSCHKFYFATLSLSMISRLATASPSRLNKYLVKRPVTILLVILQI